MMEKIRILREKLNSSNAVAIAIVYSILLLDNMLLTAVTPVLPEYFYTEHQLEEESAEDVNNNNNETISSLNSTANFQETAHSPTPTAIPTTNDNNFSTDCRSTSSINYLAKENFYIGLLFASKPFVQIFANLAVGPVVDRIGFDFPMLIGNLIMMISGVFFALGTSYPVLLAARAIQGIGSASASVAGIAMVASRYSDQDDEKRGKAIGIALGGLAMGVLIGPPYAAGVYQLAGKESVFIVLAVLAFVLAVIQVLVRGVHFKTTNKMCEPVPLGTLLQDPYILLTAFTLVVGTMGIAMLEVTQPLWMLITMCSATWELGVAFLPTSVSYLISVNFVAVCCQKLTRWLVAMIGLFIIGAGCIGIPFSKSLVALLLPSFIHGTGIGLIDASTFPMLAVLVDTRHRAVYGSVYAIADLAFCIPYVIGPLYAGGVIRFIGFDWLIWSYVIVLFIFTPSLLFLRQPTKLSEEKIPILYHGTSASDDDVFPVGEKNGVMTSPRSD